MSKNFNQGHNKKYLRKCQPESLFKITVHNETMIEMLKQVQHDVSKQLQIILEAST